MGADDWLRELQSKVDRAASTYAELPCGGVRERVAACSDDFAASCAQRDTAGCPRKLVAAEALLTPPRSTPADALMAMGVPRTVAVSALAGMPHRAARRWLARRGMSHRGDSPARDHTSKPVGVFAGLPAMTAAGAAWALSRMGGRFLPAYKLDRIGRYDREDIEALENARLLVVDQLGEESAGEPLTLLARLLVDRSENNRSTILTTTLDHAELRARYAGELAELLGAVATIVDFK